MRAGGSLSIFIISISKKFVASLLAKTYSYVARNVMKKTLLNQYMQCNHVQIMNI